MSCLEKQKPSGMTYDHAVFISCGVNNFMLKFHEYAKKQDFKKKLIDQYGKYKVFVVDGDAVRNSSAKAEEFGGSNNHTSFPGLIPEDEIWIEDDIAEGERGILISSELCYLNLLDQGKSKDAAYDIMLAKQKHFRERQKLSKKNPSGTDEKGHPDVYVRRYGHILDEDVDIFFVNGEKVRNRYKTDYIEGGHGYVYKWVPNNEIWIENGLHSKEVPYILLHEYVERILMKYHKKKYDEAHRISSKVEFAMRQKGGFTKADILGMTKKKAEELAHAQTKS